MIALGALRDSVSRHAKILYLHHFNFDASWSTECRLTQLEIFTSFLVDVATLRRFHVVTLRRIYINEGIIKIEHHLFGPKSKNRIINSERKRLFCKFEGGDAHLGLCSLPL